jgi:hypothetical protein
MALKTIPIRESRRSLNARAVGFLRNSSVVPCPGCRAVGCDVLLIAWTCPRCRNDHLALACSGCGMVASLGTNHALVEHGQVIEAFAHRWLTNVSPRSKRRRSVTDRG